MIPEAFIERIKKQSYIHSDELLRALGEKSTAAIRVNRNKWDLNPLNSSSVPWCRDGFFLESRPSFTLDPLFHAGCYYPQEASGMFLEEIFRQLKPDKETIKILDLCGAPGGKSTMHELGGLPEAPQLVSKVAAAPLGPVGKLRRDVPRAAVHHPDDEIQQRVHRRQQLPIRRNRRPLLRLGLLLLARRLRHLVQCMCPKLGSVPAIVPVSCEANLPPKRRCKFWWLGNSVQLLLAGFDFQKTDSIGRRTTSLEVQA